MLSRNKRKTYYKNESSLKKILKNYPLILLLFFFFFIVYSIIDYHYLNEESIVDARSYNSKQITKFNLYELYNQKNLNHRAKERKKKEKESHRRFKSNKSGLNEHEKDYSFI